MDEWLSAALARLIDPPGTLRTNWHVNFCDTRSTTDGAIAVCDAAAGGTRDSRRQGDTSADAEAFRENGERHDPAVLLVGGGSWPRQ
jgi:hypothetical protein